MRQKTVDLTRKIVTVFLACLLLLIMLPSDWLFREHASREQETFDEMQKIYPVMMTSVCQDDPDGSDHQIEEGCIWVGNGNEGYMQFALTDAFHTGAEELNSVKLRLVVADSAGDQLREIRIARIKNNNWNLSMTYNSRPQGEEETLLSVNVTEGRDSIVEVDLTAAVQNWLSEGERLVTLHLYGDENLETAFASGYHQDRALHPYLKLLWGNASDTDLQTVAKTELTDTTYVSMDEPETSGAALMDRTSGFLHVDEKHTAYLKFRLNRQNIYGAVSKATLVLYAETVDENAILLPSMLENNQWNTDLTYSGRPPGKMEPFGSYRVAEGTVQLDVTQMVSTQFQNNAEEITFILEGTGETVFGSNRLETKEYRPYLQIETSEDPNVMAAHETMVNLLRNNLSVDHITSDLRGSYTSSVGARATVDWKTYDAVTGEESTVYIAVNGSVTRPKWFEGEKKLRAVADIQSGTCELKCTLVLTLPPETAPVYNENQFSDTLLIGDEESEANQAFEYVRGSRVKMRNVNGTVYSYRTLGKDGAMVVNLKCSPDKQNRLYIKLWGEDTDTGSWYICDPNLGTIDPDLGPENEETLWIPMHIGEENVTQDDEGFVYAYYDLPEYYTRGKQYISLRLFRTGEVTTGSWLKRTDEGRGIYALSLKSI